MVRVSSSFRATSDESDGAPTAADHYSNTKDYLTDAIGLSRRIGELERTEKLKARLDHIKNVFRWQFQ